MSSFQVGLELTSTPSNLALVVCVIGLPSTKASGSCGRWQRIKLIMSSLVFSQLSWKKFSLDHLLTWSTTCCALFTLLYSPRYCSIVHVFPHVGNWQILIIRRNKQGLNLVPGDSRWDPAPLWQAVITKFDPLKVDNPIGDAVGYVNLLQHGNHGTVIYHIKDVSVIKKYNSHWGTITVCSFEPGMHHTYKG